MIKGNYKQMKIIKSQSRDHWSIGKYWTGKPGVVSLIPHSSTNSNAKNILLIAVSVNQQITGIKDVDVQYHIIFCNIVSLG